MASEALVAAIRQAFGRVVWTHKTHEKEIDLLNKRMNCLKVANVIVLVLTTGGTVTTIFEGTPLWRIATSALSALALGLAVYQLSFDPTQQIAEHRKVAKRLWYIREQYIHLLTDMQDDVVSDEAVRSTRDRLAKELASLYEDAIDTSGRAYSLASKALKIDQEMTFTDEEINQFLPEELRKKQ